MLVYLDRAWHERGAAPGEPLETTIERGAVLRVRPILMTATAVIMALVPILWTHGTGASVMQRIAAPMIGGMLTATVLALVVVPVLYYLWRKRHLTAVVTSGSEAG
jgi:Cu(I)/Ag(I) efflux system membrane protein CusA/SilA